MRTANIRTVRHRLKAVLKYISNGETVAITNRNVTVAMLTPPPTISPKRRQPWAGLRARLARLQAQPMAPKTAAAMLAEDRDRF